LPLLLLLLLLLLLCCCCRCRRLAAAAVALLLPPPPPPPPLLLLLLLLLLAQFSLASQAHANRRTPGQSSLWPYGSRSRTPAAQRQGPFSLSGPPDVIAEYAVGQALCVLS
jgi:hypothetical protein